MGIWKGRHAHVMSPKEFERAKLDKRLPDIYIGSGEREIEFDDAEFRALIDIRSPLPLEIRERIVRREYRVPDAPLIDNGVDSGDGA